MFELEFDLTDDRTYKIKRDFAVGAAEGVRKVIFDIEAQAKRNITDQDAIDTGAARASIHSDVGGHHGYAGSSAQAQQEAAAGSRRLRHSKRAKPKEVKLFPEVRAGELEGIVAVGVEYGANIEFGTVHMAPRPFLGPAAQKVFGAVEGVIVEEINKRLED